jgi:hypothetical protein
MAEDNVQSAMFEILKRMQVDLSGLKADVSGLKADVSGLKADVADIKGRVTRLEDIARRQRRDSAAMLVMMRATAGVFNERLSTLEVDVRMLQEAEQG